MSESIVQTQPFASQAISLKNPYSSLICTAAALWQLARMSIKWRALMAGQTSHRAGQQITGGSVLDHSAT
jgi:hypothetical protein